MRIHRRWQAVWIAITIGIALVAAALWLTSQDARTPEPVAKLAAEAKPLQLSADDARRAGLVVKRLEPTETAETADLFGTVEVNQDRLARIVSPVAGRLVKIDAIWEMWYARAIRLR